MTEEEMRRREALGPALLNLHQAEFWDPNCRHCLSFPQDLDQQQFTVVSLLVSSLWSGVPSLATDIHHGEVHGGLSPQWMGCDWEAAGNCHVRFVVFKAKKKITQTWKYNCKPVIKRRTNPSWQNNLRRSVGKSSASSSQSQFKRQQTLTLCFQRAELWTINSHEYKKSKTALLDLFDTVVYVH